MTIFFTPYLTNPVWLTTFIWTKSFHFWGMDTKSSSRSTSSLKKLSEELLGSRCSTFYVAWHKHTGPQWTLMWALGKVGGFKRYKHEARQKTRRELGLNCTMDNWLNSSLAQSLPSHTASLLTFVQSSQQRASQLERQGHHPCCSSLYPQYHAWHILSNEQGTEYLGATSSLGEGTV